MDAERFDRLTRTLSAAAPREEGSAVEDDRVGLLSRVLARGFTRRGLLGAVAALTGGPLAEAATKPKRKRKRKQKRRRRERARDERVRTEEAINTCAPLCAVLPPRSRERCLEKAHAHPVACECPSFCRRLHRWRPLAQLACLTEAALDPAGSLCLACDADPDLACAQADGGHVCCAEGQRCEGGTCEDPCPAGEQDCGGVCVDTETDRDNCGECGNVCAARQACEGGDCVPICDVCAEGEGCAFSTVQAAVNNSSLSTIRICPGAYRENVSIRRTVTLIGAGSGENGTILDGGQAGSVLFVGAFATVRLRDLAITGGNNGLGGGIFNTATLSLAGCVVRNNIADEDGGGIWTDDMLTLEAGSSVTGNTAREFGGGGIFNGPEGTVILEAGSSVTGNTAGDIGGGILNAVEAMLTLKAGSSVTGNHAGSNGGGVFNRLGTVEVEDTSIVTGNTIGSMDDPNNCDGSPPVPNCVNP